MEDPPARRPPSDVRVVAASVVALAGSIVAVALIVDLAEHLFPADRGFAHFQPTDYGSLTVIGVLAACASWPLVARLTPQPYRFFTWLAVGVTAVLWIPDVWLLIRGEPPRAVIFLMAMHLAIAVITYTSLVTIAPLRPPEEASRSDEERARRAHDPEAEPAPAEWGRPLLRWWLMVGGVVVEGMLGVATLVLVPARQPYRLVPTQGHVIYICHAAVGGILVIGAISTVLAVRAKPRIMQGAAVVGAVGILVAAVGGTLSFHHSTRIIGIAMMFGGTALAGFGYLIPIVEAWPREAPPITVPRWVLMEQGVTPPPEPEQEPGRPSENGAHST